MDKREHPADYVTVTFTLDCARCDWGMVTMSGEEAAKNAIAHNMAHGIVQSMTEALEVDALERMWEES